jgi:hypothetical protein
MLPGLRGLREDTMFANDSEDNTDYEFSGGKRKRRYTRRRRPNNRKTKKNKKMKKIKN